MAISLQLNEDSLPPFLERFCTAAPHPLQLSLKGDLGAGKTTFTRLLGQTLGISDRITSPSYIGVNGYSLPDETPFIHADFYRGEAEGAEGLLDEIDTLTNNGQPAWIIAEWTSFAPDFEAASDLMIEIEAGDSEHEESRRYTLTALSPQGEALLQALETRTHV